MYGGAEVRASRGLWGQLFAIGDQLGWDPDETAQRLDLSARSLALIASGDRPAPDGLLERCIIVFHNEDALTQGVRPPSLRGRGSARLIDCPNCSEETLALTGCHTCGYRVVGDD